MIYYNDNSILIRAMRKEDAQSIHNANLEQGWHSVLAGYDRYFSEQEDGTRYVFIAEVNGQFAGYTTLKPKSPAGPFAGFPEISDFNVYPAFRRKGLGTLIMDAAEKKAAELGDTVTLGVGLHNSYGAAQRMYVKRGYIPDGSGVWYQDRNLEPYADCCNDDDLVLHFSKKL